MTRTSNILGAQHTYRLMFTAEHKRASSKDVGGAHYWPLELCAVGTKRRQETAERERVVVSVAENNCSGGGVV
jgi:hypothetical protein